MVLRGWSRKHINAQIYRSAQDMFVRGVESELVNPEIVSALREVSPLRKGKTTARETEDIGPVDWNDVAAVLSFVSEVVSDMIQLHWLTGMRSDELTRMQRSKIEIKKPIWLFVPQKHKTESIGKKKVIALGPNAQRILSKYMDVGIGNWDFSAKIGPKIEAEQ